jgi:hypothetical protein
MKNKTVIQIKFEQSEKIFKSDHSFIKCLQDVPGKSLNIISDTE